MRRVVELRSSVVFVIFVSCDVVIVCECFRELRHSNGGSFASLSSKQDPFHEGKQFDNTFILQGFVTDVFEDSVRVAFENE